jgi:hypothetical protein
MVAKPEVLNPGSAIRKGLIHKVPGFKSRPSHFHHLHHQPLSTGIITKISDANLRPNTARLALKYGKKYSYVIECMDIKDLLILPPAKQRHIMKALASLAKYNGLYEQWNSLRRQHNLKWSSTNTLIYAKEVYQ